MIRRPARLKGKMGIGAGRKRTLLSCVLLLLLVSGCGGTRRGGAEAVRRPVEVPPVSAGPKVAVAPMENRSNDLDASEIVRSSFAEGISAAGWSVMPVAESARVLRERLGVSYGGQLGSTTPAEVCGALGVDGVFYGEVLEWNKTTTGIYNKVAVTASFRLFGRDGALAWEGSDTQSRVDVPRGGRDIGAEIVVHALGSLLLNPMAPYGKTVGKNIARKVPAGILTRRAAVDNVADGIAAPPADGAATPGETGGTKR